MRSDVICLLSCAAWLAACGRAPAQANAAACLPAAADVAGWEIATPTKTFAGSQLFDYMDGAGEIPRSYGFRELASCKYRSAGVTLEAAVFDMGDSANAFGYYSARSFLEQNPSVKERVLALDHPAHLYAAAGVLTFWKGRFTIVLQPDTGKPTEAALTQFARAISRKIRDVGRPPEMLNRLPKGRREPNSERFLRGKAAFDAVLLFSPRDVFDAAKGSEAVSADYKIGAGVITLFVVRCSSGQAASALQRLRDYLASRKATIEKSARPDLLSAYSRREKGVAASARGALLEGVLGAPTAREASADLGALMPGGAR